MEDEKTLFEKTGVKVTTKRAIIGAKTYAMSDITSVNMKSKAPSPVGFIMKMAGFPTLVCALVLWSSERGPAYTLLVIFLLLVVVGYFIYRNARTRYAVIIGSSSGESNALQSDDEAFIENVVTAVNDAIVGRE